MACGAFCGAGRVVVWVTNATGRAANNLQKKGSGLLLSRTRKEDRTRQSRMLLWFRFEQAHALSRSLRLRQSRFRGPKLADEG